MHACLAAGISYCGSHNSSNTQWAYKVGPCHGIDAADQLCMSRFLLARVAEHSGAGISYDGSSPHEDGRGGGGTHSNKCTISFSTANSRDPISGLGEVQCMMERLHTNHLQHALCFPEDSVAVVGGNHTATPTAHHQSGGGSWHSARDAFGVGAAAAADEGACPKPTTSVSGGSCGSGFSSFTVGVGNKHASIMVPTSTLINRCGPILDRRPPASSDPYLAIMLLVSSACGIKLPIPQLNAAQLAAALASATAAATGSNGCCPVVGNSGAMTIPSAGAAGAAAASSGHRSFSYEDSLGPSCSYGSSMLCGSIDSRDVLLSELDRLDGYHHQHHHKGGCLSGVKRSHGMASSGYCHSSGDSDVCSDASSPPVMSRHLAAAGLVDEEMY